MVVRQADQITIHLSEIDVVVVETTAAYISSYLLAELARAKVPVLFCDLQHKPAGQYVPLYAAHDSSRRVREQAMWDEDTSRELWRKIIQSKIKNQAKVLRILGDSRGSMLEEYAENVLPGDVSNREGHAAKVYFNALFGMGFSRDDDCGINACLNYGYAILLAWVSREISSRGYLTQLGINHKNDYNHFNLSCDFMEPFRPVIDLFVAQNPDLELTKNAKIRLLNLFSEYHEFDNGNYRLSSILGLSVKTNLGIMCGRIDMEDYLEFELYEG